MSVEAEPTDEPLDDYELVRARSPTDDPTVVLEDVCDEVSPPVYAYLVAPSRLVATLDDQVYHTEVVPVGDGACAGYCSCRTFDIRGLCPHLRAAANYHINEAENR